MSTRSRSRLPDGPQPRRPEGRYDEPRTLPRPVLVTGAILLVALLVGLAYLAFDRYSHGRVRFATLGYAVLSDTAVEVRFEVHKGLQETVRCAVQARDRDGAVVARDVVTIGPADLEGVLTVHQLTTTRRAATGEVTSCSVDAGTPTPSAT
jgi:hypothetical protein